MADIGVEVPESPRSHHKLRLSSFPRETKDLHVAALDKKEKKVLKLAKRSRGILGYGIIPGEDGVPMSWSVGGFRSTEGNLSGSYVYYETGTGFSPNYETTHIPPSAPDEQGNYNWTKGSKESDPGAPKLLRKYGFDEVADQVEKRVFGTENPVVYVAQTNSQNAYAVPDFNAPLHVPLDFGPPFVQRLINLIPGSDIQRKQFDFRILSTDGAVIQSSDGKIIQIHGFHKTLVHFMQDLGKTLVPKFDENGKYIGSESEQIPPNPIFVILNYDPNYKYPPVTTDDDFYNMYGVREDAYAEVERIIKRRWAKSKSHKT